MQIIAMHSRPEIGKVETQEHLNLIETVALTSYIDEEGDGERWYHVEAFLSKEGFVSHYWEGSSHTKDLAAAMTVYNNMVSIIDHNAIYIQSRNGRAESIVMF